MKTKYILIFITISLLFFLIFYKLNNYIFLALGLSLNLIALKFISKFEESKSKSQPSSNELDKYKVKDYAPLLKAISDGIICVSKDKRILFQNIKLSSMLGNRETKLQSINFLPKKVLDILESTFISSTPHTLQNFKHNNYIFDIKLTPITKDSKVMNVIISFKDISSTYKVQKLKSELVTNISHEFKTPLTSIQGYSELLLENSTDLNSTEKKYLNKILTNSKKLMNIYEDLLSLSKVENETILEKEEFDIKNISQLIFNNLQMRFPDKIASIDFDLKFESIFVNRRLFERVISNLFENSFKYSNQELSIEIVTQMEGPNKVLKIKDNGIGIPNDKKDDIFQRFFRLNESRSGEVEGLGLGLSIVKNIIEKHSGIIQVGDTETGCLMIIILPN